MITPSKNIVGAHEVDCCYCASKVTFEVTYRTPLISVYTVCEACGCFLSLNENATPVEIDRDRFARLPLELKVRLMERHHIIFQNALIDARNRNERDWRKYNTKIQAN